MLPFVDKRFKGGGGGGGGMITSVETRREHHDEDIEIYKYTNIYQDTAKCPTAASLQSDH